ncbi:hypothetical protein OHA25_04080 [Nonomuraea sp. NBC_00507]|uniref:hypothetical protein n=1 Tax=Nonomuraea sp. NBC_00507 TaxID=2976002 RepID=UPI002E19A942
MGGIDQWREFNGVTQELVPLLDDDAPVVRVHGGRRFLVEVRAAALVALQDSYRRRQSGWNLGAVRVRRAMPVDEAMGRVEASLDELDPQRRQEVLALAENALRERVDPPLSEDAPACRAYLVLLQLGQVYYHEQHVDPQTLLTPLQEEIHAGQMVSQRPRPHVRFDDPHRRVVGYLYRTDGRWVLDMDESPHAGQVTNMVQFWRRLSRGGVPRLVLDQNGVARGHPSGQGLLTEGIVPHDTDEPLEYLRSVAAFVAQRHAAELVVHDDGSR